jgi:hypothetical protein
VHTAGLTAAALNSGGTGLLGNMRCCCA